MSKLRSHLACLVDRLPVSARFVTFESSVHAQRVLRGDAAAKCPHGKPSRDKLLNTHTQRMKAS